MSRELRPAQVDIVAHIVESIIKFGACGVWAVPGLGKTASALVALDALDVAGVEVYPALVVAPIRVAKNTWPQELDDWSELLSGTTMSTVVGNPKARSAALAKNAKIYTINFENIQWLVAQYADKEWPFKMVVADESTHLSGLRASVQVSTTGKPFLTGQGSKRAKDLLSMTWKNRTKFIELTGTPATRGLEKLWAQLFFLDYGMRLGRTFEAFVRRWYSTRQTADGYTELTPFPHAQKEIQDKVTDICRSFDAKTYYNVRDPVIVKVWVDLPPTARKQYQEMEKKFFTEIKEHKIEAFSAGTKSQKLSQFASGAAYVGDDDGSDNRPFVTVHDEKLEALSSIVEEAAGMPILCVYFFKSDLARLKKRFPDGVVFGNKKETENAWNRGEIPILFVHYQSAGHGVNLQHGSNLCVLFSATWSLELHIQVIERIGPMRQMASGYDRAVMVYMILARNTIDELMLERQSTHRNTMDILMEAAKRS